LFGLVTVYSRETGVFGSPAVDGLAGMDGQTDDATVLSELGRAVGHAISALERQQALVNDEFVEVEFRSRALADRFAPVDGVRFVADRAVSLDDGTIVTFASVTGDVAPETYLEGLDGVETVSDARLLGTDDDGFRVSVRTEGQTLPGTLATHGGRTTAVTAAADGLRLTAELPRTAHGDGPPPARRGRPLGQAGDGARTRPLRRVLRVAPREQSRGPRVHDGGQPTDRPRAPAEGRGEARRRIRRPADDRRRLTPLPLAPDISG
jgi:hypothetical protein